MKYSELFNYSTPLSVYKGMFLTRWEAVNYPYLVQPT